MDAPNPDGKSKAFKHWNKFAAWAAREGLVRAEVPRALEEFVVNPVRIPPDARQQVDTLFRDWFLHDRRLIGAGRTPLELFLTAHARSLKASERAVYERFRAEGRFGFFRVDGVFPGQGLTLTPVPEGAPLQVHDLSASRTAAAGDYLMARLLPFSDHWVFPSFVSAFPAEAGYGLDRIFGDRKDLKAGDFRPRHVLSLFVPKADWQAQGLDRVRARLAMLLQRWGVSDLTAAAVEQDVLAAHARRELTHPLRAGVLARAPNGDETEEAAEVLKALWNLTLGTAEPKRGSVETRLLRDLQRAVDRRFSAEKPSTQADCDRLAAEAARAWSDTPQAELGGRTPLAAIVEERKSLGNPRTELGIKVVPTMIENRLGEAFDLSDEGKELLLDGEAADALAHFEKAYPLMKGHKDACRVLLNMAIAHAMLGRQAEAVDRLRAALKENPDYELARKNLRAIEGLSPAEFKRRHREGHFAAPGEHREP